MRDRFGSRFAQIKEKIVMNWFVIIIIIKTCRKDIKSNIRSLLNNNIKSKLGAEDWEGGKQKILLIPLSIYKIRHFKPEAFHWAKDVLRFHTQRKAKCGTSQQQANKSSDSGSMKDKELSRGKDTKSQGKMGRILKKSDSCHLSLTNY